MNSGHPLLQFFPIVGKGEPEAITKAFAELAEHMAERLPDNPERAQCLRKLLEARDNALRALAWKNPEE